MPQLVLIKHSLPEIDPNRPAAHWQLSAEGVRRCSLLAEALKAYPPAVIVSSHEPKAQATAAQLATIVALPFSTAPDLEEHHRARVPFQSDADFQQAVRRFFAQPDELVFGEETANTAHARFQARVAALLAEHPQETLWIVAHGTVISLYVSRLAGREPFSLWQGLGLPAFVAIDRATGELTRSQLPWEVGT